MTRHAVGRHSRREPSLQPRIHTSIRTSIKFTRCVRVIGHIHEIIPKDTRNIVMSVRSKGPIVGAIMPPECRPHPVIDFLGGQVHTHHHGVVIQDGPSGRGDQGGSIQFDVIEAVQGNNMRSALSFVCRDHLARGIDQDFALPGTRGIYLIIRGNWFEVPDRLFRQSRLLDNPGPARTLGVLGGLGGLAPGMEI